MYYNKIHIHTRRHTKNKNKENINLETETNIFISFQNIFTVPYVWDSASVNALHLPYMDHDHDEATSLESCRERADKHTC